jgi:hypothetical protein
VEIVEPMRHVFLHLVGKINDRFIERGINIKFTSGIGAMLSEAYGGEDAKGPRVFHWHKLFRTSCHFEITNEESA